MSDVEYRPIPGCPGYRAGDDGSILSDQQVIEIISRRTAGESGLGLAREFGVSQTRICQIFKKGSR